MKAYSDVQFLDSIIVYKDSVITAQNEFIRETDKRVETLDKGLTRMKKKRNRAFIIGGAASIASFIVGLFVF